MMAKVYVLVSDVGLNGNVVHGVYSEPPSQKIIGHARAYSAGTTGYGHTIVEERELDSPLPCGGDCSRPLSGGSWSDCYCYRNRCNDRGHDDA